jgi:hypothetical protein
MSHRGICLLLNSIWVRRLLGSRTLGSRVLWTSCWSFLSETSHHVSPLHLSDLSFGSYQLIGSRMLGDLNLFNVGLGLLERASYIFRYLVIACFCH